MSFVDTIFSLPRRLKKQNLLNQQLAYLNNFATNQYGSPFEYILVDAAIDTLVREIVKFNPQRVKNIGYDVVTVERNDPINKVLREPNPLMTQSDFLKYIGNCFFRKGEVYIYQVFNDRGEVSQLWPIPFTGVPQYATDKSNQLFVQFTMSDGTVSDWMEYRYLIHIRNRYYANYFTAEDPQNSSFGKAMKRATDLANDTEQNVNKAMKASYDVSRIIHYNTYIADEDKKNNLEVFLANLKENQSGWLPLDMESKIESLQPQVQFVDKDTIEYINDNVLAGYGTPLSIILGTASEDERESWYTNRVEDIAKIFEEAFTKSMFTKREKALGDEIKFFSKKIEHLSTSKKLELLDKMMQTGTMMENEKRVMFGMLPLPELESQRLQSLNYVNASIVDEYQLQSKGISSAAGKHDTDVSREDEVNATESD